MDDTDKKQFAKVISAMFETFAQESTPERLFGYWLALRHLEMKDVELCVAHALQTCTRVPVPADLLNIANLGTTNIESKAASAWSEVQRAMPLGSYKSIDFADKAINATIRYLGGWPKMFDECSGKDGEKWYRMAFCKAYATLVAQGISEAAALPLAGIAQIQVVNGQVVDSVPVRIGTTVVQERIVSRTQNDTMKLIPEIRRP